MNAESRTGYAPIHGMQIYYEIHGQGKPVILLHGGITAFEGFGTNIDDLAKSRQVIAVHLQGHGNTADIDRPYRFEALADDVAALVTYLKLGKVDVVGYSFGGGVALQTAIRHPEVVDHLVVISSVMAQTGFYPDGLALFAQMSENAPMLAESVKKSPLATMYPKTNWEASFRKMGELCSTPFDWSAQVAAIKTPTLLIFADADAIRAEHIVEFYKSLGGAQRDAGLDGSMRSKAQLAILPGTTHYNIITSPSLAVVIGEYLRQ
jgi:pimeloyl-ACP methyl ester carboxylesterase